LRIKNLESRCASGQVEREKSTDGNTIENVELRIEKELTIHLTVFGGCHSTGVYTPGYCMSSLWDSRGIRQRRGMN